MTQNILSRGSSQRIYNDKWAPGHYVKLMDSLLYGAGLDSVLDDINNSTTIRGGKIVMPIGKYYQEGADNGEDKIDYVLNYLNADKKIILSIPWRYFGLDANATEILPLGMHTSTGYYGTPAPADVSDVDYHLTYQYMWAYSGSSAADPVAAKGYNLKLYDETLLDAFSSFFAVLAAKYDSNPKVVRIDTTESAHGNRVVPYGTVTGTEAEQTNRFNSQELHRAGMKEFILRMIAAFPNTPVCPQLNFPNDFVADLVTFCLANNIGFGSPNGNRRPGLNEAGAVLTYYPTSKGKVFLSPEVQADDTSSTVGSDASLESEMDHPPYAKIFHRWREELHANYMIWQYGFAVWNGGETQGVTVPSLKTFLNSYPPIVNGGVSGGLPPSRPTGWRY